ncbi:MAG: DEAD/DEAH box helicase [Acidobacteria bacterium]|nr:DEAD/DEAH box helicase [Acidobacteriaceae bacterium]MBV9180251.1 DEAD/DEAH box helicase [Acidobacteriota bacterium]
MSTRHENPPPALPHQETGTEFLRGRTVAALFDEQGLGKSRQLIDAIIQERDAGNLDGALIICPNTIKPMWGEEIERYASVPYAVFGSGRAARRVAFRSLRAVFYVMNYEAVAAEMPSLRALLRFKRMALVLDESHRIKTPTAKVTTAIQALRNDAARRFIMTGTPVANKPEDLWAQYFFLDDGASLGTTFAEFQTRFGTAQTGYTRIEELRESMNRLSLRRPKDGTIELPSKTITRVPVKLQGAQRRMYDDLRTTLALWIRDLTGEEILTQAENILTRLIRLAQLASNPGLLDTNYNETPAKYTALDDLLATYLEPPSSKVIVWTSFVGNIAALQQRYPQYRPVTLHGEMDGPSRQRAVRDFKNDPGVRVLVANPAAAREGLTLTQASTAIYVDRTFNLVDFLQSQDRIHRLSQTQACEIILLVAENSIDEFVDFSIAQKHRLARYTQSDTYDISPDDLALQKPDLLRALIAPGANSD